MEDYTSMYYSSHFHLNIRKKWHRKGIMWFENLLNKMFIMMPPKDKNDMRMNCIEHTSFKLNVKPRME